jgi:hypothetical protein
MIFKKEMVVMIEIKEQDKNAIEKSIKEVEADIGRKMTDEEKVIFTSGYAYGKKDGNYATKGFGYHKDFDSVEELAKYLARIQRTREAYIKKLNNGNWRLHWDW